MDTHVECPHFDKDDHLLTFQEYLNLDDKLKTDPLFDYVKAFTETISRNRQRYHGAVAKAVKADSSDIVQPTKKQKK